MSIWSAGETVSVLIAVRDGAAYLGEAIESALDQSYRPIELVVVDDGSRDGTAEVVSRFGSVVVYERQPPVGMSAGRTRKSPTPEPRPRCGSPRRT